jgi:hypothetical protein
VKSQGTSHGGNAGRSLIERIEIQMDKRRKTMEDLVVKHGTGASASLEYVQNQGRYEGLAAALSLLRSSSVAEEIKRSDERLGIE